MARLPEQRPADPRHAPRPVAAGDDEAIAALLSASFDQPEDPGGTYLLGDTARASERYLGARAACFVVSDGPYLLGLACIAPLRGARAEVCELREVAVAAPARRQGIGLELAQHCFAVALAFGYQHCYAEIYARMQPAAGWLDRLGFSLLNQPVGRTGRYRCDRWYLRDL